jgi:hypothetical protein
MSAIFGIFFGHLLLPLPKWPGEDARLSITATNCYLRSPPHTILLSLTLPSVEAM